MSQPSLSEMTLNWEGEGRLTPITEAPEIYRSEGDDRGLGNVSYMPDDVNPVASL